MLSAQEYSYVYYNTRDGLAGSTIYDMCQDKDGFIWFATEAGLSRFDGTRFKNFTTADGLPEVEILKLYADHQGRVWIAPFKNTICYYYQGKIYTSANDSLLKKVKLNTVITHITGDKEDNIFLCSVGHDAYLLQTRKGPGKFIDLRAHGRLFSYAQPNFFDRDGLIVSTSDSTFILANGKLQFWSTGALPLKAFVTLHDYDHKIKYIKLPVESLNAYIHFDAEKKQTQTYFALTNHGAWMVDTLHFDHFEEIFLKEKQVNSALIDNERNIWFGTGGEGVYKLVSRNFKTYSFKDSKTSEIFSLTRHGQAMLAGTGFNRMYSIVGSKVDSIDFYKAFSGSVNQTSSNRLVSIKKTSAGNLVLGFDLFLFQKNASGSLVNYVFPIKSIDEIDAQTLLVGTGRNVIRVREKDLKVLDTIWPYRSTAVSYYNDSFYVGTVDGLHVVSKDGPSRFLGKDFPSLRYRTACFARSADGILWTATYGGGVVGMKDNRIIGHLTTRQGISSDICRSLFVYQNYLWVGTDKGINKVDISKPTYPVHRYSTSDGLPSDIINAIYVDSSRVYVGSPAGLTTFDEKQVSDYSRCDLRVLDISVSGLSKRLQPAYELGYNDNNLRIEFVAISFKSGGDIMYRYRLKGLKDSWDSTRQNQLEYPSLPSGNYQLELLAINKFGVVSNPVIIPFLIDTPYWQAWWFKILVVGFAIGLTATLVAWRFSIVQRREKEKIGLQQKIHELEQLALLSQMNPHFIFNCLNSIQAFIINNDVEKTNQYLTEFAYLIRQTMDSAEKGVISIGQEVRYLTRYIELEKMRFGHSFEYTIETDVQIDQVNTCLPSMLLQPYVENSIRHGIRHKRNGQGVLEIKFQQSGDQLLCIVEDNGIGRESARQFRSHLHVEYQSKGMTLAAARVKALNRQYGEPVVIEIIDKTDQEQRPTGTRVEIYFPYKMLSKLS
ncbi:sensor histidine kinase [Paraflavitalea soli]|uniref:sensor histidine kinase n=1 Tax=Paraflavitalea soli TaxID=2315862 RepID=UPI001FE86B43|nr:sensor histidine kinase [Paraflavitalea soli]